jgi:hypothetical protein
MHSLSGTTVLTRWTCAERSFSKLIMKHGTSVTRKQGQPLKKQLTRYFSSDDVDEDGIV